MPKPLKLAVKPINKRTGWLPKDADNCNILLLKTKAGLVVEHQLFFNHKVSVPQSMEPYSHYIVIPNYV